MGSCVRFQTQPRTHTLGCLSYKRIFSAVLGAIFAASLCSTQTSSSTNPIMLGDNVALTCPSHKSSGDINWTGPNSGKVISTHGVLSVAESDNSKYLLVPAGLPGVSSTLIINKVGLKDDGVYRCLDADSLLELRSVNVTVMVSVQTIQVTAPTTPVHEGSFVTIVCTTDGSKPAPHIVWVKQESDRSVTPKQLSGLTRDVAHANGTVQRTSSVDVLVGRSDYLASYTCTATVSVFSRHATWNPDVFLTPMSPWLQPSHTQFGDGDIAHFTCVTSSARPAAQVMWYIHNQPISDSSDGQVSNQDREDVDGTFSTRSRLDVTLSRGMNGADVMCSVTNTVLKHQGEGPRNASISIVVQFAPVCVYAEIQHIYVNLGDTIAVPCPVKAFPRDTTVTWTSSTNQTLHQETKLLWSTDDTVESVMHYRARSYGDVVCYANNSMGGSSRPCTFRLTPPVPPSAPHDCQVVRLPNDSHQVLCSPGKDGGSPQAFFIRVRTSTQKDSVLHAEQPDFILDGLESDADFNLTVCAVSRSLPGHPVCAQTLLFHTESLPVPTFSASGGEETELYIILGAVFGCCFIAIAVFITIVVCRRRKAGNSSRDREGREQPAPRLLVLATEMVLLKFKIRNIRSSQWWDGVEGEEHAVIMDESNVHDSQPAEHSVNSHNSPAPDGSLLPLGTSSPADRRAESVLLPVRRSSAAGRPDGKRRSRLSLRKSWSVSAADNIPFKTGTKVYTRMSKEERDKCEDATDGGKVVDGNRHPSDTVDNAFSTLEGETRHRYSLERDDDQAASRRTHGRGGQTEGADYRKREGSTAGRRSEHRLSDPSSGRTSFSDMIRNTLHRNRSSLLPNQPPATATDAQPTAPLISPLGPSHSPYYIWSPTPLSVSQTSLASDNLGQCSDYDVPKASSDWQRAMSLLSLSAIGSGVLYSPESRDGYIDMTQGQRHGGSVPDLERMGKKNPEADEVGDYYLVPSNKNAYINLAFDGRPRGRSENETDAQTQDQALAAKKHNYQSRPRVGEKTEEEEDGKQQRRWSSSEQKIHEMSSAPLSTTTFRLPPKPRLPGFESASMKLSPAPQLKLRSGRLSNVAPQQECSTTELHNHGPHQHLHENQRPESAQRTYSTDGSPSYVKMERNLAMSDNAFDFDCAKYDNIDTRKSAEGYHGSDSERNRRQDAGDRAKQLPRSTDDCRLRLLSSQRNRSYTQAQKGAKEISPTTKERNPPTTEATRTDRERNPHATDEKDKGSNSSVTEASSRKRKRSSRKLSTAGREKDSGNESQYRWLPVDSADSMEVFASDPCRSSSQTSMVSRESSF